MKNNRAIFVCGAGGSGKSTYIKEKLKNYKHIDVDIFYEKLLKNTGLHLKIKEFSKEELSIANQLFEQASNQNHRFLLECIQNKIDVVIESIGRDVDYILEQRNYLEKNGYQTSMIMIYKELDVCIDRVEKRERSYSKNVTIKSWNESYKNIENYKTEFRDKFYLINDDYESITESVSEKRLL